MKLIQRMTAYLLSVLIFCAMVLPASAEVEPGVRHTTTILFTHDLHSHFLPVDTDDGGQSGGYARLATVLKQQREKYPDALTLDAGDFSIGSLIQTLFTEQAAELRTMGTLGFDVTTIGNHEFDHTGLGFAQMLNAAAASGDKLPAVVAANYAPSADNPNRNDILRAMDGYGVKDAVILERGGVKYGIFGLIGVDSHDCAPTSGFDLEDMAQAARRCVDSLRKQGAQFIICLSHGGTSSDPEKSEDELLAKAVKGIDMIVSGHTHTTLREPLLVNGTYIVSCGPYCRNLGAITLSWDESEARNFHMKEYKLIPIDETVADDPDIAAMVEDWKQQVGEGYLSGYGLTYDQVLTHTDFELDTPAGGVQQGNNLGELVADSFLWAVHNLEKDAPNVDTVTVTADGVLRASLPAGDITTSMAFDVLSMGVGSDGTSGFPLVGVYLTGKELKAAAEVDASVTPIMSAAQLYMSGMKYSFNVHRMFFNRVTDAHLMEMGSVLGFEGSGLAELEDDRLYRVVTGMYSAQMLGTVKSKSVGLLSLEPKMADGSAVTDFNECILYDKEGNEIKEWYALAAYLQSFSEEGLPERYRVADGRKDVSHSWNPIELVKNPNWITLVVLAVILLAVLLVILLIRKIFSCSKKKRRNSCKRRG